MKNFCVAMKIFLLSTILIFPAKVSAVDVWVESDEVNKIEYYLMTQNIKENYKDLTFIVGLKSVFKDREPATMTGRGYQFVYENGEWYVVQNLTTHSLELVKDSALAVKFFNACAPYVNLVKDYPIKNSNRAVEKKLAWIAYHDKKLHSSAYILWNTLEQVQQENYRWFKVKIKILNSQKPSARDVEYEFWIKSDTTFEDQEFWRKGAPFNYKNSEGKSGVALKDTLEEKILKAYLEIYPMC